MFANRFLRTRKSKATCGGGGEKQGRTLGFDRRGQQPDPSISRTMGPISYTKEKGRDHKEFCEKKAIMVRRRPGGRRRLVEFGAGRGLYRAGPSQKKERAGGQKKSSFLIRSNKFPVQSRK